MRITRLSIKDFGGITIREAEVAASGAIIRGRNGAGKTSVLRALHAALTGDGANADSVRLDAERAEITIDTDTHRIRRVIKRAGASEIEVTNNEGDRKAKPAAWLRAQFGSVDPLRLLHAKPADRRAMILGAVPAVVTPEMLAEYAPGLPAGFSTDGHGFDVIERARVCFYDRRTTANAKAKAARDDATRASERLPANVDATQGAPTVQQAEARLAIVRAEAATLRARREQHAETERKAAATRARITQLRKAAQEVDGAVVPVDPVSLSVHYTDRNAAQQAVQAAEAALTDAKNLLLVKERDLARVVKASELARSLAERAAEHRANAADLELTLSATSASPVADAELAAATEAEDQAATGVALARAAEVTRDAATRAALLDTEATRAEADARALDVIVRRLTKEAPAALLEAADGPRGLTLDGDTVRLDGVSLDDLCGQERMCLAVRIAKRMSAAKILLVDGLEALDPEQRDLFIDEATGGGWQLLGTLVDRGDVQFCAIEPSAERSAAE